MTRSTTFKASIFAGLLAAFGTSAHAADLTVGANIGNVPWEFEDASGKVTGFEVDLVNEIAKRLGKTVEFVNTPFNGLFPAVQSGRINMAISSITIAVARASAKAAYMAAVMEFFLSARLKVMVQMPSSVWTRMSLMVVSCVAEIKTRKLSWESAV